MTAKNDPPVDYLYSRIGRLTVELDALRGMLAASRNALKEADAEVSRLRESVADADAINRSLKDEVESLRASRKAAPFVERPVNIQDVIAEGDPNEE